MATTPSLHITGVGKYLPFFRRLWSERLQYLAFVKRQVLERTQDKELMGSARKDVFSFLLNAKDPEMGHGLSKGKLWMEGNTLIVAGSDTASTTMAASIFHLTRNPLVFSCLTNEIRSTFSHPEDRLGPRLQSCTYLRACIDETLRLSPPISGLLPRRVLPGGLKTPALGVLLPEGIDVGTCIFALQHHPGYVVNPDIFDPSRFLQPWVKNAAAETPLSPDHDGAQTGTPRFLKQNREALPSVFNPFSLGPRSCAGKPLAYLELSLTIARLVWEYEIKFVAEGVTEGGSVESDLKAGRRRVGEYHIFDWFVRRNEGPWVVLRLREGGP